MRRLYNSSTVILLMVFYRCVHCGQLLDSGSKMKEHARVTGHKFMVTIDIVPN